jgi:hypothetical protein
LVLTLSPTRRGINDGATTMQICPIATICRYSPYPVGPAS